MRRRRIYTAWDSREDESTLFRGLRALTRHGVQPKDIMVYMLIGYWNGESEEDWLYRQRGIREFGAMPYPMPFVKTPETRGFQRWCVKRYDKIVTWDAFKKHNYRPEGM